MWKINSHPKERIIKSPTSKINLNFLSDSNDLIVVEVGGEARGEDGGGENQGCEDEEGDCC